MFSDDKSVYDYIRSIDIDERDDVLLKLYYLRDDRELNKLAGFGRLILEMESMIEICKRTNYGDLRALPDPTEYLLLEDSQDFL